MHNKSLFVTGFFRKQMYTFLFSGLCTYTVLSLPALAEYTPSPLDAKIASFSVEDATIGQFAAALSRQCGVMCGVFRTGAQPGAGAGPPQPASTISLARANVAARDLLDEAMQQAPSFVWTPVEGNLINILPVDEISDPNSVLNAVILSRSFEEVTLLKALFGLRPGTNLSVAGHEAGGREGKTSLDRPVSCSIRNATFLDGLNAVFRAAGSDVGWLMKTVRSGCLLSPYRVRLHEVVPQDLADAEAYLKDPERDRDVAVSLFQKAVATAPNEPLKAHIEFKLAKVYLAEGFQGVQPQCEEALAICRRLVDLRIAELHFYRDVLSRLARCLVATGEKEQAKQLYRTLIQSEADRAYFLPRTLIMGLAGLQIEREDPVGSLARLKELREFYPLLSENAPEREWIEHQITRFEKIVAKRQGDAVEAAMDRLVSE